MPKSMTSFARVTGSGPSSGWTLEIRSVNHRFFECSLKLPPSVAALEGRIREVLQSEMHRGKIAVMLNRDTKTNRLDELALDEEVAGFYVKSLKTLQKRFHLKGDVSVEALMTLPGLFGTKPAEEDPEKSWPAVKSLIGQALKAVAAARELEGKKLTVDIRRRMKEITRAFSGISKVSQGKAKADFSRLKERVAQLVGDNSLDPERLHREVAFLVERSDITEELVRMKSHLELFEQKLKGRGEMGRELDFLCQEMNREVNTMASKAQSFEISSRVVFIKGELEKIREQIQNIE